MCANEGTVFVEESNKIGSKKRPAGLHKNEADVSLAARSVYHVVLTNDVKKSGPLKSVKAKYRTVINLADYKKIGISLAEFVKSHLKNNGASQ